MTGRDLQERAAALFVLAEGAFGERKDHLGNELTALALQYLDQAHALESVVPPPSTVQQQPAIQQQQQPQSKKARLGCLISLGGSLPPFLRNCRSG